VKYALKLDSLSHNVFPPLYFLLLEVEFQFKGMRHFRSRVKLRKQNLSEVAVDVFSGELERERVR
jgi:hypothetical protein